MSRGAGALWGLALIALATAAEPARAESAAAPAPVVRARLEDGSPPRPSRQQRLAEIRRRIQAALRYPSLAAWREVTGETLVRFEIAADLRAHRVEVARSSGVRLLDRAAARAVIDAGELPFVYGPLEVPVRFRLNGSDAAGRTDDDR